MKANNKINFTHRTLGNLPFPASGKRATYFDTKVDNLNIIITHNGTKTFYVRKNINGQSKRVRLGNYVDGNGEIGLCEGSLELYRSI